MILRMRRELTVPFQIDISDIKIGRRNGMCKSRDIRLSFPGCLCNASFNYLHEAVLFEIIAIYSFHASLESAVLVREGAFRAISRWRIAK